jgi:hypothetical protein
MTLSGIPAACEARALMVSVVVGESPAVRLAFAWAKTDAVSVLRGEVNFFMEFDVSFYRSRSVFEVRPKQATASPPLIRRLGDYPLHGAIW